jgi:site-specific DNA-cytosine methylase
MINRDKIILHLCADIGSDTTFYQQNDYDVRLVGRNIGIENYHPPNNVYGIIANPPCTHFSIARTVGKIPRDLQEGMKLVKECLRVIWECQYKILGLLKIRRQDY